MKTFIFTPAFATILAGLAQAAPALESRQFQAQVTFFGAADASYSLSVPTDGSLFQINNSLSVSRIQSLGGATCAFHGINGSDTIIVGARTADVAPPQVQVSGSCLAF
ncbi:hypothetical protein PVAG01_04517 [Phlyctema vagabunda]|uniref:Uncharacterized protein n=1 Tax=Phlyctema vagabunda TaxID=108571 RepID=A0ABR4PPF8_9HELO